jgi:hypothetical protein
MADQDAQSINRIKARGVTELMASRGWQLATILIPIILTGWLTFISSRSEDRIKLDIEQKNQLLSAQLSLTTELFKRRFDTYETLYRQLIDLKQKLLIDRANNAINARLNPSSDRRLANSKRETADLEAQLDRLKEESTLHMSDNVSNLLSDAWLAAVQGDTDGLSAKIVAVQVQMKVELENQMVKQPAQSATDTTPSSR